MLAISLGRLALPVAPLALLLSVWGASRLAAWLASSSASLPTPRRLVRPPLQPSDRRLTDAAGNAVVHAALLGLLAARLVYLSVNADLYKAAPWSALDLRDGGWQAGAGAAAGAAWLLWRGWHTAALRRPLAVAAAAGTLVWSAASLAVGLGAAPTLPSIALTPPDGGAEISLQQAARGRPLVVNLWASWCPPCRAEMPMLAAAQQRVQDVGFLFVNEGESASAIRAYLTDQDLPLREVLLDPASKLGPAVGSPGLPTTLFYDAGGRLVDAHFGSLNAAALESRLRNLHAGR